ncbi:hypothetical protein ANN_08478 [Periplaneta americana]|uniref:Uncharacterized protein n=1 Tax=Periplaneta americana TaxID=6978 RepID=A0ABQ8T1I8_PERAM|nr:hypothetical protein ANN_08478 [Periplaneta americana]
MLKQIRKRKLTGSLAKKKLPTEGCTGEREESSGLKKVDNIKIYDSYAETKRNAKREVAEIGLGTERFGSEQLRYLAGYTAKNKKEILYPNIPSAIRAVPHGPDIPIPLLPESDTLSSTSSSTETESLVDHTYERDNTAAAEARNLMLGHFVCSAAAEALYRWQSLTLFCSSTDRIPYCCAMASTREGNSFCVLEFDTARHCVYPVFLYGCQTWSLTGKQDQTTNVAKENDAQNYGRITEGKNPKCDPVPTSRYTGHHTCSHYIQMEMGWTHGQATRRQMDIPSYHMGPPRRKETSRQTSAQMGRLLQRTGRSTVVQRGKRQKKVETTGETFVHRQEVVKGSERIIVKEIQVLRLKYHV